MKRDLLLSGVQKEATKCVPQLGHWLLIITACVVCKILSFEFCFLKNYLGVDTFAKELHDGSFCFSILFKYHTQNLFLSSFPFVHILSYWCLWAGAPARTVGWRDPGFIHTSFLKELWPNAVYVVSLFLHIMLILGVSTLKNSGFWAKFM